PTPWQRCPFSFPRALGCPLSKLPYGRFACAYLSAAAGEETESGRRAGPIHARCQQLLVRFALVPIVSVLFVGLLSCPDQWSRARDRLVMRDPLGAREPA